LLPFHFFRALSLLLPAPPRSSLPVAFSFLPGTVLLSGGCVLDFLLFDSYGNSLVDLPATSFHNFPFSFARHFPTEAFSFGSHPPPFLSPLPLVPYLEKTFFLLVGACIFWRGVMLADIGVSVSYSPQILLTCQWTMSPNVLSSWLLTPRWRGET